MPALLGVASTVPRTEYHYKVSVLPTFDSTWLPTQAPISPHRRRRRLALRPLHHGLPGRQGRPDHGRDALHDVGGQARPQRRRPGAGDRPRRAWSAGATPSCPAGIPTIVRTLANEVTRDAPSRYEKAVALQDWFREDGGFTYDLADAASGQRHRATWSSFLTPGNGGRTGYCEQFASSMAVMARMLGIPARVAVGFLEPRTRSAGRRGSTAPTTCTPGRSSSSPASGWVRLRAHARGSRRAASRRTPASTCRSSTRRSGPTRRSPATTCRTAAGAAAARPAPRRRRTSTPGTGTPRSPGVPRRAGSAASCCWPCSAWSPARSAGCAASARSRVDPRRPGRSCGPPRSTSACPGRSPAHRGRRGTGWCRSSGRRSAPAPRSARRTGPGWRRRGWPPSTGWCAAWSSRATPGARTEPASLREDLEACLGRAGRRRLAGRPPPCRVVAAVGAHPPGGDRARGGLDAPRGAGEVRRRGRPRRLTRAGRQPGSPAAVLLAAAAPAVLDPLHEGAAGAGATAAAQPAGPAAVDDGEAVGGVAGGARLGVPRPGGPGAR